MQNLMGKKAIIPIESKVRERLSDKYADVQEGPLAAYIHKLVKRRLKAIKRNLDTITVFGRSIIIISSSSATSIPPQFTELSVPRRPIQYIVEVAMFDGRVQISNVYGILYDPII